VRGLVRSPDSEAVEALAHRGMSVWTGDLTRPDSLVGVADGVEYVLNLTSRLAIENGSVRRTYVDGNQNLIAACSRSRSVRTYLFTSSVAPYGDAGDALVDEDHPVAPTYPLGEVLAEAERTILRAAREHRFPAIYGPGRDPVDAMVGGVATLYGDGRNYVSHIHLDDLLAVLERIPAEGQPGSVYNVGDDEPLRQADVHAELRQRLGMVPPRSFSPQAALAAGIDPSVVGMSVASVRLDNRRLKHDLGLTLRHPSVRAWLDERLPVEESVVVAA
jgi:nucleoside-diphosphate-sugar epimerase